MPAETYHDIDAVGGSSLKLLARSPAHYAARRKRKTTSAMQFGTLAHTVVLEPAKFADSYIVAPAGLDMRTKAGKDFKSEAAGLQVVSMDDYEAAQAIRQSAMSIPTVARILDDCRSEVSLFWEYEDIPCKARIDALRLTKAGAILLDLKTTQDASPESFPRSVGNYGYHLQAAHYCEGWRKVFPEIPVIAFLFVAVETDAPYAAAAYTLDDEAISRGEEERARLLSIYRECKTAGRWPSYSAEIQSISLPAWA